jgi:hypothetical protein
MGRSRHDKPSRKKSLIVSPKHKAMDTIQTQSALAFRRPPGTAPLPDNAQWKNRFEIKSETSDRIYIVAQNKQTNKFACSCPAYITRRYCKHLLQGCNLLPSQIHGNGQIAQRKTRGMR